MAGYSGTPLAQKLGIKPGATVVTINAPLNYQKLLGKSVSELQFTTRVGPNTNFIHFLPSTASNWKND